MAKSARKTITATELVRSLSAVIDEVRVSGYSLYITKGSKTVAELRPPPKKGLSVNELINILKTLPKLGDDVTTMENDLQKIRNKADLPKSPWG